MERKLYILENIILWGGIVVLILCGLCLQIMLYSKNNTTNVYLIILIAFLLCLYFLFLKFLKKRGFEQSTIKPYEYATNLQYADVLSLLSENLSKVCILNEELAYVLAKKRGIRLHINIMYFDVLSKDILKQRKKYINRIIRKRHKFGNRLTLANSYNKVRINLIIVRELNEYCGEIVWCNATRLFSMPECVLNIILSEKDNKIYVPKHFGLNKFGEYYKVLKLIKSLFAN